MRKKVWIPIVLGLVSSLVLGACQAKSAKPQSSSSSQSVQQQESEETENSPETVEMMTVGTDAFGYVDLPANWITLQTLTLEKPYNTQILQPLLRASSHFIVILPNSWELLT